MIKANRKSLDEIYSFIESFEKILVLGCGGCSTVCHAGGEKEVGVLAQQLRLKAQKENRDMEFLENTVERQCEPEFVDPVIEELGDVQAVVSTACGVGVNHMVDRGCKIPVFPGLDTTFMGATKEHGVWEERCAGCGQCILHLTGGICPIARCAKNILNGPCGGTNDGMCEISTEENPVPCVWAQIVERMEELGTIHRLNEVMPAKDWSTARDGGPRRRVRADLQISEEEEEEKVEATS